MQEEVRKERRSRGCRCSLFAHGKVRSPRPSQERALLPGRRSTGRSLVQTFQRAFWGSVAGRRVRSLSLIASKAHRHAAQARVRPASNSHQPMTSRGQSGNLAGSSSPSPICPFRTACNGCRGREWLNVGTDGYRYSVCVLSASTCAGVSRSKRRYLGVVYAGFQEIATRLHREATSKRF